MLRSWSVLVLCAAGACTFPTPSHDYVCSTDRDCDPSRQCTEQLCIVRTALPDAAPVDSEVVTVDADPFAATRIACLEKGYVVEATAGASLYRYVTTPSTWFQAERVCEQDVVGATHLIVFSADNAGELALSKTKLSWVGFADGGTNIYKSVTAETFAVTPNPWAIGQPDNGDGNENCAQMKTLSGLDDDQCNNLHPVLCECDGKPPRSPIP